MSVPPVITAMPSRAAELGALLERWANINSGSGHAAGLARMAGVLRAAFAAQTVTRCEEEFTVAGDLKQFQVVVRPDRLAAYNLSLEDVRTAAKRIEPGPRAGIGVLEAPTALEAEFRRAEFHELDQPFGIAGDVIP